MSETISINVNGQKVKVQAGISIAAALMNLGIYHFRKSPTGEKRGVVCGMGICFECRAKVDGKENIKTCQMLVWQGVEIETP